MFCPDALLKKAVGIALEKFTAYICNAHRSETCFAACADNDTWPDRVGSFVNYPFSRRRGHRHSTAGTRYA